MSLDPITAGLDVFGKVIDKIFPDKAQADAAKAHLLELQINGDLQLALGQQSTNTAEANSTSVFVAGWRPFIGWVCGCGCAWNWIGLPIAKMVIALLGYTVVLQMADLSEMMPLLLGMLGIGGMRTLEKIKGVA